MMRKNILIAFSILCLLIMSACQRHRDVPDQFIAREELPVIYPDYVDVTIPSNIAPSNFLLVDSSYTEVIARLSAPDGTSFTYGQDLKVQIDIDEWKKLLVSAAGQQIQVEVFARTEENKWAGFKPFAIHVAKEPVDEYISYRLLPPGFVLYNKMCIAQRNLTNYEEREIYNNYISGDVEKGQCINCHNYQNYRTDNMLFHVRVSNGGTILVVDGKPRKVELKRPYTISSGVYPSWHPTERLVAFSTDQTHQMFYTNSQTKIEVFDKASDLILYDIDKDSVVSIAADSLQLEVFPTWSPDGQWLYYCSAAIQDKALFDSHYRAVYESIRYNIYRRSFNVSTRTFGEEELVYDAVSRGKSCSLPRISPDGRYLTFAEGDYGYFNIWHQEADIRVLSLSDSLWIDASQANSKNYAESYPSWSSNGRWLMCASRKDDGNYSRVYISYFDGKDLHKAFELPWEDPEHNIYRLKSYNRPEFMIEPVNVSIEDFAETVKN